jgi:hypothetical protein
VKNNEARIALEVASLQIEVACNDVAGAGRSKRDEDMVAAVQRACNELRGSWLMLTFTERCERAATHSRVSLEDFTKAAFTNGSVVHRALDKSVHALAKAPAEEPSPSLLSSVRDACTLTKEQGVRASHELRSRGCASWLVPTSGRSCLRLRALLCMLVAVCW